MKNLKKKIANIFNSRLSCEKGKIFAPYSSYPEESTTNRRFYNVGAGNFYHPCWTNIDYATDYYSSSQKNHFINHNLMSKDPLPIQDDIAEVVYSSHTIEHLTDDAVVRFLKDSHRILKPGGFVRIACPDSLLFYKAYKKNDKGFWYWTKSYSSQKKWIKTFNMPLTQASIEQLLLNQFAGQLSTINKKNSDNKYNDIEINKKFESLSLEDFFNFFSKQCEFSDAYPGNHINWWTEKKLIYFLNEAGFSDCYRSGYGQSLCPPLRDLNYFDKKRPKISLYIEAIK